VHTTLLDEMDETPVPYFSHDLYLHNFFTAHSLMWMQSSAKEMSLFSGTSKLVSLAYFTSTFVQLIYLLLRYAGQ